MASSFSATLQTLAAHVLNPMAGPLHRLDVHVTHRAGNERDAFDAPGLEPLQPQLALMLHQLERDGSFFVQIVPHVATEHYSSLGKAPGELLKVGFEVDQVVAGARPESNHVHYF